MGARNDLRSDWLNDPAGAALGLLAAALGDCAGDQLSFPQATAPISIPQ